MTQEAANATAALPFHNETETAAAAAAATQAVLARQVTMDSSNSANSSSNTTTATSTTTPSTTKRGISSNTAVTTPSSGLTNPCGPSPKSADAAFALSLLCQRPTESSSSSSSSGGEENMTSTRTTTTTPSSTAAATTRTRTPTTGAMATSTNANNATTTPRAATLPPPKWQLAQQQQQHNWPLPPPFPNSTTATANNSTTTTTHPHKRQKVSHHDLFKTNIHAAATTAPSPSTSTTAARNGNSILQLYGAQQQQQTRLVLTNAAAAARFQTTPNGNNSNTSNHPGGGHHATATATNMSRFGHAFLSPPTTASGFRQQGVTAARGNAAAAAAATRHNAIPHQGGAPPHARMILPHHTTSMSTTLSSSDMLPPLLVTPTPNTLKHKQQQQQQHAASMHSAALEGNNHSQQQSPNYSRKTKSLGVLCENFVSYYQELSDKANNNNDSTTTTTSNKSNITLCIDQAAVTLGVERRRVYDVINCLEALKIVTRKCKNTYHYIGTHTLETTLGIFQQEALQADFCQEAVQHGMLQLAEGTVLEARPPPPQGQKKSLGKLSELFLKLFLVGTKTMTYEYASDKILGVSTETELAAMMGGAGSNSDATADGTTTGLQDDTHYKPTAMDLEAAALRGLKTKIRRLYDVANVFCSLKLIKKVEGPRKEKPRFVWAFHKTPQEIREAHVTKRAKNQLKAARLVVSTSNAVLPTIVDAPTPVATSGTSTCNDAVPCMVPSSMDAAATTTVSSSGTPVLSDKKFMANIHALGASDEAGGEQEEQNLRLRSVSISPVDV